LLGRFMTAQCNVPQGSPMTPGWGLHVKLPVPVSFELGYI